MPRPRLFHPGALSVGTRTTLTPEAGRHAVRVLRLEPGAECTLFNGDGHPYHGVLETTDAEPQVLITRAGPPDPVPPLRITLGQAVARGDRMDFALQKAVELGAEAIVPLFTARTVVRLDGSRLQKRIAHWQGVIRAACEQSGRNRLPALHPPASLHTWLKEPPSGLKLLLDPEDGAPARSLVPPRDGRVTLLIGPEGGLDETEHAAAVARGFRSLWLGPRVLRAETAPLAALAVLQGLWGDLGGGAQGATP